MSSKCFWIEKNILCYSLSSEIINSMHNLNYYALLKKSSKILKWHTRILGNWTLILGVLLNINIKKYVLYIAWTF